MMELRDTACPLCGAMERKLIGYPKINQLFNSLEDHRIDNVRVVQCTRCSLYYAFPLPFYSSALLEKMYSREYFPPFTSRWERICRHDNIVKRFSAIERLAARPVKDYLEIGCGLGYGLEIALSKGWQVTGQDISPDVADSVKSRLGFSINLGPISASSFDSNQFDCIYMDSVLEHVSEPLVFFNWIVNFLRPGGILYVVVPNDGAVCRTITDALFKIRRSRLTSRIAPFIEPYHVVGFSKRSINYLAGNAGMRIVSTTARRSFGFLKKSNSKESARAFVRRMAVGALYTFGDILNDGINLEAALLK